MKAIIVVILDIMYLYTLFGVDYYVSKFSRKYSFQKFNIFYWEQSKGFDLRFTWVVLSLSQTRYFRLADPEGNELLPVTSAYSKHVKVIGIIAIATREGGGGAVQMSADL